MKNLLTDDVTVNTTPENQAALHIMKETAFITS